MSHQIIYNRLFIKAIDKDNSVLYIPMVLSGSNNCTQINDKGREIRERSWYNSKFLTNDKIFETETNILKKIDDYRLELIERWKGENGEDWSKYKDEHFGSFACVRFTGKPYCSFNTYKNFYALGMKQALTMEQLKEKDISVKLYVSEFSHNTFQNRGLEVLPNINIDSTEMLLSKVKEYEEYYKGIDCLFVMYDNEYDLERFFKNKKREIQNKKEKKEQKMVEVDFYFVLLNGNSLFVKNTKRSYKYTGNRHAYSIKKWMDEKKANTFHKKMRNSEDWTVAIIREKATFFVTN